jgi:hypothetical protein
MTYYASKTLFLKTATLPDLGEVEYVVYPPRVVCGEVQTLGSADFYKWRNRIAVTLLPDGTMRCHKRESTEGCYGGKITKADREMMRSIIKEALSC